MDADNKPEKRLRLTIRFNPDQLIRISTALKDIDAECSLDILAILEVEELEAVYATAQVEGWEVENPDG